MIPGKLIASPGEPEFSAPTGDEEMTERGTRVCKGTGSPFPFGAAAEGARGGAPGRERGGEAAGPPPALPTARIPEVSPWLADRKSVV